MYLIVYRTQDDGDTIWRPAEPLYYADKEIALKKYAMRVKEYGKKNVIIAKALDITCVCVEVLCDGITVNSQ